MGIEEKIGQLLIVGIQAPQLDAASAARLRRLRPGGVILFARNLQNPQQARHLAGELNGLLSSEEFPLWLCVDQEGGVVVRLTRGVGVFPGNMALGAAGNLEYARAAGRQTALEWGALGVNVNFAPVLDLSYAENPGIGVRSLGKEKEKVAALGAQLIGGMQENGMMATAKHFPGKGLARLDSHLDLPVIAAARKTVLETEMHPFRRAVEAGVGFLMTSHSVYSALDPGLPATLSRRILHDLAREEIKFPGLIVSDDMEMGAIAKKMPIEEACLQFLLAGGDQLLICHTPELQEKVFSFLLDAVKQGKLTAAEIDSKLERIRRLKREWSTQAKAAVGIPDASTRGPVGGAASAAPRAERRPQRQPTASPAGGRRGYPLLLSLECGDLPLAIARDSITIVKNEDKLIPLKLKPDALLNVVCADYAPLTLVEEETGEDGTLHSILKQFHPRIRFDRIPVAPEQAGFPPLEARAKEADLNLIFTYNAHLNPSQGELVRRLVRSGKPAVVCALRNPYDFAALPEARHAVASYGYRRCSLQALVEALFGKIEAKGKLPVSLS